MQRLAATMQALGDNGLLKLAATMQRASVNFALAIGGRI